MANPADQMAALGDATRREVFEILSGGPSSVADIARRLPVSRPAVSQHLRVLKDAGLVTLRTEGTRNVYQLDPKPDKPEPNRLKQVKLAARMLIAKVTTNGTAHRTLCGTSCRGLVLL
jgi:DNA-binding transcriptional ArsR family regulator